jgi:MOSC domain-containing protein YiiM
MMIVRSLNIGMPKTERFPGRELITGICKQPVPGPLALTREGFAGDGVGDRKHHGGSDKAVCLYGVEHYPYWAAILGTELPVAAFGENLSVSGMLEDDVCIGDLYRVGTAVLQVSQPRQPCGTLAARYGRSDLVKLVVDSSRTGFYCRVTSEGEVREGDAVTLLERDPRGVTITFANRILHQDRKNSAGIEQVLSVPALSASWRQSFLELREHARRDDVAPGQNRLK